MIAVDLPSGINGNSGAVMGAAVTASENGDVLPEKTGPPAAAGQAPCGTVEVADIGIPDAVLEKIRPGIFANAEALWADRFPVPQPAGINTGAVMRWWYRATNRIPARRGLRARGALRSGAGLVTIASPRDALAVNAAGNLAVMVRPVDGAEELSAWLGDPRLNTIVLGPGGGGGVENAGDGARGPVRPTGGGAGRRRAHKLCRRPRDAVCRDPIARSGAERADPTRRRVRTSI